jgi:hypothetical protein
MVPKKSLTTTSFFMPFLLLLYKHITGDGSSLPKMGGQGGRSPTDAMDLVQSAFKSFDTSGKGFINEGHFFIHL